MKRILLAGVLLITGWRLHAQVAMTLQVPPMGLTLKPQLWNLSMVNTSGQPVNVQLNLVMTDMGTGEPVMTASTPHLLIPPGVKMITPDDVSPVFYQAGAGYMIDPAPSGFLPIGVFNVCYDLVKWTNDISEQLAEECMTVEVEPLSPPQLVQPGDSDRISFNRPFFIWLPPTPVYGFSTLQYDWVLAEVQATQSASDAIQQNLPLLTQPNISFTSFQYPLSMPELDTGKIYAWQVTAKSNGITVANSEIWSFKIQQFAGDSIRGSKYGYYSPLRREKDASFIICAGVLRYQYNHEQNNSAVQISITDISHTQHRQVPLDSAEYTMKHGANYMALDLSGYAAMVNRHMYLLELVNNRNEHWYLKFEYRKPEN
jgi:hypothetical protein